VFALAAQAISAGLLLLRADGRERPRHVFDLVLLAPAIGFVQPDGTGSYTTGLPATLAALAALSAWFAMMTDHLWPGRSAPAETPEDPLRRGWLVVSVAALLAAAVCLKQNAAVIAATALPMAVVSWWRLWRPSKAILQRAMRYAAILTLGIGLSWAARGVVLTGYPLFPQTIMGMPVEWKVPLAHAEAELAYAVHSARTDTGELDLPGANRPFSWLSEWWTSPTPKLFEMWVPLVLGLMGLLVYLVARSRAPPDSPPLAGPGRWMMGPIAIATVTWFVVAPAPRYGTFLIWAAAGLAVAEAARMVALGAVTRRQAVSRRAGRDRGRD
jgi:hypothetical protein